MPLFEGCFLFPNDNERVSDVSQMSNTVLKTFSAGDDLSSARYHFVKLGTGVDDVVLVDDPGDIPIGIVTDFYRADEGMPVTVAIGGTCKVVAAGAIARGAWVGSNADGRAVAKNADGDMVRGIALEAATNAGDIIEVMLVGPFVLNVPGTGS